VDRSIFSDITPGLFPVSKGHAKTPYAKYAGDSVYAMLYQFRKLKEDVATSAVIDYTVKDVINLLKALK
ncbi:MAG: hypothetical protein IIW59_03750, partial [Alistipes sp.]|nr:hypothetical protein [Alistipes sp.]